MYQAATWTSQFKTIVETDGGDNGGTPVILQCATPSIAYEAGKLIFRSETDGAQYHYTITDSDIKTDAYSENGTIELSACYNISVWASAEGYTNSETSTAKLYFIEGKLDDPTSIQDIPSQRGIVVSAANNTVTVSGLNDGETVEAYSLQGTKLARAQATGNAAQLNGITDKIVIVRIGKTSIKVTL